MSMPFLAASLLALVPLPPVQDAPGTILTAAEREAVDALLADFDRDDAPGLVAAAWRGGELVLAEGRGLADVERRVPLGPQSRLRIASTSKQFTAACVALLVEDGALTLDTPVHELFPELAAFEPPVRVRHLVAHQSGLPDYLWLMGVLGLDDETNYPLSDVIDLLARVERTIFEPGTRFAYSNTNYLLLGELVARASGSSLREFARERLFEPLGMVDTHFHDRRTELVPDRALAYARDEGPLGWELYTTQLELVGDGGVFTTVGDLFLWTQHLAGGPGPFDDAVRARLLEPFPLADGRPGDYAFGLGVERVADGRLVSHSGAFVGYRAELVHCPEGRWGAVVLANREDAQPTRLALGLVRALGLDPTPVGDGASGERVEPAALPEWARELRGLWVADGGVPVRIGRTRGALVLDGPLGRHEVVAQEGGDGLVDARGGVRLEAVEDGLVLVRGDVRTGLRRPAAPPADVRGWDGGPAGAWRVRELDRVWRFVPRADSKDAFDVELPDGPSTRALVESVELLRGPFGSLMWPDGDGWVLWSEGVGWLHLERASGTSARR